MSELTWMPILMYHRIVEQEPPVDPDRICTSVGRLADHLDLLAAHDFAAVPLELACRPPEHGEGRRFAITFDDGYEETLRLAQPVLEARSLPATVFVVSSMIGGNATWNDEPRPLLTRTQLLDLHASGMFIGSHGRNHRRLSTLEPPAIQDEVQGSREELEQLLGVAVRFIAYPHHDLDARVAAAAASAGYAGAAGGRAGRHERYNLHRIDAGRMSTRELLLHASGLHRWARRQPMARAVGRAAVRFF
ncbi:MAG: polysaccharide deacetylase family protein [Chloroflexi bacterium]|nr:MAG: polysaccharide deacetylase family protein [Chloroflexota bacterium]